MGKTRNVMRPHNNSDKPEHYIIDSNRPHVGSCPSACLCDCLSVPFVPTALSAVGTYDFQQPTDGRIHVGTRSVECQRLCLLCGMQVTDRVEMTVAVGGRQRGGGLRASAPGARMTWRRDAPICWHGNVNNVCSDSSATFTLPTGCQGNRTLTT